MKHIGVETLTSPMSVDVVINDTSDRYPVRLSLGNLPMYFSEEGVERTSGELLEMARGHCSFCKIDPVSPGSVVSLIFVKEEDENRGEIVIKFANGLESPLNISDLLGFSYPRTLSEIMRRAAKEARKLNSTFHKIPPHAPSDALN